MRKFLKPITRFFDSAIAFARQFPVLNKVPVSFYKFFVVGSTGFVFDFILFNILYYVVRFQTSVQLIQFSENFTLTIVLANITAVALGSIIGYILNRNWSFESKSDNVASQYGKYLLVAVCNNLINNLIFGLIIFELLTGDQRGQFVFTSGAKILATSFQVVTSYFLYKFVVFRADKEVVSEAFVP